MMSYEQIAQQLGLSKSSVRRIEQRALRKIRRRLEGSGYTLEDMLGTQPNNTHTTIEEAGQWDTDGQ